MIETSVKMHKSCISSKINKDKRMAELTPEEANLLDTAIRYYTYGGLQIVKDWIVTGAKETPEEMRIAYGRCSPKLLENTFNPRSAITCSAGGL